MDDDTNITFEVMTSSITPKDSVDISTTKYYADIYIIRNVIDPDTNRGKSTTIGFIMGRSLVSEQDAISRAFAKYYTNRYSCLFTK